jgi:hypothetical protein
LDRSGKDVGVKLSHCRVGPALSGPSRPLSCLAVYVGLEPDLIQEVAEPCNVGSGFGPGPLVTVRDVPAQRESQTVHGGDDFARAITVILSRDAHRLLGESVACARC